MASNEDNDILNRCTNITFFNCTLDEYLYLTIGPRMVPLETTVPVTIVLIFLFLSGIFGNICVCVVVVKHRSLHTPTNYYLFSLAISDLLLLLLGLPNDLSTYWHQYPYSFGSLFCKSRALVSEAVSYVSVLTILAFSLERYLAICHPLHLYTMTGLQRPIKIITALWIIALISALPFGLYTDVNYTEFPPGSSKIAQESAFCGMLTQPWYICELSTILFFIVPAFTMLYLYIRMGLRIRFRHSNRSGAYHNNGLTGVNGSVHCESRQTQARKNIIRMLAAVVVAFFVCWAPFHVQRLFYLYGSDHAKYREINELLFPLTGFLYYVSATVNPVLYSLMSKRYRAAFKSTLCCSHRKRSLYLRDHSSFRDTTMNQNIEGIRLIRHAENKDSIKKNCRNIVTNSTNDYSVSYFKKSIKLNVEKRLRERNKNDMFSLEHLENELGLINKDMVNEHVIRVTDDLTVSYIKNSDSLRRYTPENEKIDESVINETGDERGVVSIDFYGRDVRSINLFSCNESIVN